MSAEVINTGIDCLNQFIASQSTGKSTSRLESFTLEEMTSIVTGHIGGVSVNVFALSLVHLKRLDLGTENCIRVYKARRYY